MTDGNRAAERRQLRQDLRTRRRALPAADRIAAADSLANHLLALPFAPQSGYVAGYWAMDGEIALHAWQIRLPRDCVYCLPVLCDDQQLRFAPWRPGDALVSNHHGIPEPDLPASALLEAASLSLVVVPLVGFDEHGHRLGMGGGWYDRSFTFRRERSAPPHLVGAAFALQQMPPLSAEAWDVRLDAVCTESRCFDFTSASNRNNT
jgi:5-formyltetrahydrofolate cyclo-ligase